MRIDWAGLMRVGLGRPEAGGLGLDPAVFWRLGPVELRIMLGIAPQAAPLGRARLAALMAAFPDGKGAGDGSRDAGRAAGGAGGDDGLVRRDGGGL